MTPDYLRGRADECRALADEAAAAGDVAGADQLRLKATLYEQMARDLGLTAGKQSGKVKSVTHEQRESISKAMMGKGRPPDWMVAARRANLPSLNAIAGALGKTPSFISQVASGKKRMPPELAAQFEKLTGYPASKWR